MRLDFAKNLVVNFAGMVFVGCTFFLAWNAQELEGLLSLRGAGFLLAGLLLIGGLIGFPLGRLHRSYAIRIVEKNGGELNDSIAQTIRFSGTLVMVIQVVAVYFLTNLAYEKIFG